MTADAVNKTKRSLVSELRDFGPILESLANAGRLDPRRILVLRTVSNFDRQPRGMSAAESLANQRVSKYGAYLPSLEAAYTVGHVVVHELLTHWPDYVEHIPTAPQ